MSVLGPWIGHVPLFVVLVLVRTDRRIIRFLRTGKATHPSRAMPMTQRNRLAEVRLRRLMNAGAIGEAAPGHYYLIESGYADWRARRRRGGLIVVAMTISVVAVLFAAGAFR